MSAIFSDNKRMWKAIIIGVLISLVMCVLLTCLFALVIKFISGVPYGIIDYVMAGIEGLSVLLGAYITSAIAKSRGLINGLACAGIVLIIQIAAGLSTSGSNISILTVIRIVVMLICGIIGGIAGVNRKEKVHIK